MESKKKPVTYECGDCDKIFNNFRYYQRHVEGHLSNNCTQCTEKFTHRKHLNNHMFHVHNVGELACFECTYCQQKYVKRVTLITHIAKNHANGKHPCLECAEMFDTQEALDEHAEEHDKQKPYSCDRCGAKFHRKQQYFVHMKQHDKYECITCNEKYADKKRAMEHKRLGHQVQGTEPKFKCELCPKRYLSKAALDLHVQTHQKSPETSLGFKEEPNNEHDPDKTQTKIPKSPRKNNSDKPKTQEDELQISPYVCEICRKIFDKRFKLANHIKVTHNDQAFSCSLCSYQCHNKLNLLDHMRLHLSVERLFECDICGKSFYRKTTLREHQNIVHNEVLQFPCEKCGMQFKRSSELKRHLQSHSDERPHVCTECGQTYKRKTHLTRHLSTTHGILTPQNQRLVQRLVKNENGEFVPIAPQKYKQVNNTPTITPDISTEEKKRKEVKDIISDLENSKSFIKLECVMNDDDANAEDVLNLITATQCDLIEQYTNNNSELWIDDYSSTTSSDLTSVTIPSNSNEVIQQTFADSEQFLNHTSLQFDHIDTKDLIVLSTEQMLSVDAVVENSHKEELLLPDYLQTFYL